MSVRKLSEMLLHLDEMSLVVCQNLVSKMYTQTYRNCTEYVKNVMSPTAKLLHVITAEWYQALRSLIWFPRNEV